MTLDKDGYMSDWKSAFAAAQRYAIAQDEHDEEMMSKVEQFCDALDAELNQLRVRIADLEAREAEAAAVIARGVELMTHDQVGRWTGVRAWLEQVTPESIIDRTRATMRAYVLTR
jgi:hypothetical protein